MIQFKLKKEWLFVLDNQPFNIIDINIKNVFEYETDIKWLIDCFHKRYVWNGFPNWEQVIDRLNDDNNFLFLCQYNDKIIGWCWAKRNEVDINKEHIKFYTKTNNTTAWGYNDFLVSNKIREKPKNSGTLWLNLVFKTLFENGITDILADVESWQEPAIKMCEGIGMKKIDWISELFKDA